MEPRDRCCRLLLPLHRDADGPIDMLCGIVVFLEKASLSESDRLRVKSGFTGLFDCLCFEAGAWRDWKPDQSSANTVALR